MIQDFYSKTIGIIGGKGGMGRWFETFFRDAGFLVRISDLNTALSNEELVKSSDVVILATPIAITPDLARKLGPLFTENQLLADLTSLKEEVMEAMLESSVSAVLGIHPLFGPHTQGISGQNLVLVPGRGEGWFGAFEELFKKGGCAVHRMEAGAHDEHMCFVQGITHLFTISLGAYMQKKGLAPEIAHDVATPTSRLNVDFVGRLFSFDLELYADLISKNPHMERAAQDFLSVLEESAAILFHGTRSERGKWLQDIREFLGPLIEKGFVESNRVLDFLVRESVSSSS